MMACDAEIVLMKSCVTIYIDDERQVASPEKKFVCLCKRIFRSITKEFFRFG